jgi:hypothetical protein
MVATQRLAKGDVRKVLQATVAAFLGPEDERPEVFGHKEIGNNSAKTREWHTWYEVADEKSRNGRRRVLEAVELNRRHISIAILRRRDIDGAREAWDTGKLVDPMICIGAGDGSVAYVAPVVPDGLDLHSLDNGYDETVVEEEEEVPTPKPKRKRKSKKRVEDDEE